MDIVLATNTEDPFLALKDLERHADGSGYGCKLSVRSTWLTADLPFFFEAQALTVFIAALREMDRTLTGEALLKPMWEEPYLRLEADHRGRIHVSGLMIYYDGNNQQVRFGFVTDQTCLPRLISDLTTASQS